MQLKNIDNETLRQVIAASSTLQPCKDRPIIATKLGFEDMHYYVSPTSTRFLTKEQGYFIFETLLDIIKRSSGNAIIGPVVALLLNVSLPNLDRDINDICSSGEHYDQACFEYSNGSYNITMNGLLLLLLGGLRISLLERSKVSRMREITYTLYSDEEITNITSNYYLLDHDTSKQLTTQIKNF